MLEAVKPQFNALLKPLAGLLAKSGVRPNHLTAAGLLLFGTAAWFAYSGNWRLSLAFVIIGSFCDALDGILARETGRQTVFGAIFDSSIDRLTEIVLLLGILGWLLSAPLISFSHDAISLRMRAWGVVFCYTAAAMSLTVSYIKARCEGAGVRCSGGFLQRPERIILLCLGLFLGQRAMVFVLALLTLLGAITVVQRFAEAYVNSREKNGSFPQ